MQLGARLKALRGPRSSQAEALASPAETPRLDREAGGSALGPMAERLAHALGFSAAPPRRAAPASSPAGVRGSAHGPGHAFEEERLPIDRVHLGALGGRALAWPHASSIARDLSQLRGVEGEGGRPTVVLDLETTGLLPGGGAIPAVVGLAIAEGDEICVRQWSLRRGAAEGAMLGDVAAVLGTLFDAGAVLVTFNGRSFDWPVLSARIARWHPRLAPLVPEIHVDLLPIARRVLPAELSRDHGIADHRLPTLERRLLSVERVADVSGADVARILHRTLVAPGDRWAAAARRRVIAHNRADVLTPLALVGRLAAIVRAPSTPALALGAARHLAAIGRPRAAIDRLESLLATAGPRGDRVAVMAALGAAELRRRAGDHAGAAALWARVCAWDPGHVDAHERLAKHLEHRLRDPAAALAIARASQAPCPRRLARLHRKAAERPIPPLGAALAGARDVGAASAAV